MSLGTTKLNSNKPFAIEAFPKNGFADSVEFYWRAIAVII
jgi:hypothetical protein